MTWPSLRPSASAILETVPARLGQSCPPPPAAKPAEPEPLSASDGAGVSVCSAAVLQRFLGLRLLFLSHGGVGHGRETAKDLRGGAPARTQNQGNVAKENCESDP